MVRFVGTTLYGKWWLSSDPAASVKRAGPEGTVHIAKQGEQLTFSGARKSGNREIGQVWNRTNPASQIRNQKSQIGQSGRKGRIDFSSPQTSSGHLPSGRPIWDFWFL